MRPQNPTNSHPRAPQRVQLPTRSANAPHSQLNNQHNADAFCSKRARGRFGQCTPCCCASRIFRTFLLHTRLLHRACGRGKKTHIGRQEPPEALSDAFVDRAAQGGLVPRARGLGNLQPINGGLLTKQEGLLD